MKNSDLINDLVQDLTPVKTLGAKDYNIRFIGLGVFLFLANIILLPIRHNLSWNNNTFYIDSLFWLVLLIITSFASFKYLIPGINTKKSDLIFLVTFTTLTAFIVSRLNFSNNLMAHFLEELQIYKGPCAVFILTTSFIHILGMRSIIKRGFISNPVRFSLLYSIATGSIGALAMQLICVHESSEHILVWHYPAFFLFALLSYSFFKKVR